MTDIATKEAALRGAVALATNKDAPTIIYLLDYGTQESTWCDDPSPSGEDHHSAAYIRGDAAIPIIDALHARIAASEAVITEIEAELSRGFSAFACQHIEAILAKHRSETS